MKKLLLVLIIALGLNMDSSAQLVTYEIDATAYSNGLTIPSPFFFTVKEVSASIINGGLSINSLTINHTDTVNVVNIKNDSINSLKLYPVTQAYIDTMNLDGLIENIIKKNLTDLYGINNVTKLY